MVPRWFPAPLQHCKVSGKVLRFPCLDAVALIRITECTGEKITNNFTTLVRKDSRESLAAFPTFVPLLVRLKLENVLEKIDEFRFLDQKEVKGP